MGYGDPSAFPCFQTAPGDRVFCLSLGTCLQSRRWRRQRGTRTGCAAASAPSLQRLRGFSISSVISVFNCRLHHVLKPATAGFLRRANKIEVNWQKIYQVYALLDYK